MLPWPCLPLLLACWLSVSAASPSSSLGEALADVLHHPQHFWYQNHLCKTVAMNSNTTLENPGSTNFL
jgi:hypothetical protein